MDLNKLKLPKINFEDFAKNRYSIRKKLILHEMGRRSSFIVSKKLKPAYSLDKETFNLRQEQIKAQIDLKISQHMSSSVRGSTKNNLRQRIIETVNNEFKNKNVLLAMKHKQEQDKYQFKAQKQEK